MKSHMERAQLSLTDEITVDGFCGGGGKISEKSPGAHSVKPCGRRTTMTTTFAHDAGPI